MSSKDPVEALRSNARATRFPFSELRLSAWTEARDGNHAEGFRLRTRFDETNATWTALMADGSPEQARLLLKQRQPANEPGAVKVFRPMEPEPADEAGEVLAWYWDTHCDGRDGRPIHFDSWKPIRSTAMVLFDVVLPVQRHLQVQELDPETPPQGLCPPPGHDEPSPTFRVLEAKVDPSPALGRKDFSLRIWLNEAQHYDYRVEEYAEGKLIRVVASRGWRPVRHTGRSRPAVGWAPYQRCYVDCETGRHTVLTTTSLSTRPFPEQWLTPVRMGDNW